MVEKLRCDTDPLHIVLICPSWPPQGATNGIVTYVSFMERGLIEKGHRVTIVTHDAMWKNGVRVPEPTYQRVTSLLHEPHLRFTESGRINRAIRAAGRKLRDRLFRLHNDDRIDIIEVEESFGWCKFLQNRRLPPAVVRLHGPITLLDPSLRVGPEKWQFREKEENRALKRSFAVTSPSSRVLDSIKLDGRFATTIYNPISIPEDAWSISDCDKSLIFCVGRFDRRKGVDLLISAFSEIIDAGFDSRLIISGPDTGIDLYDGNLSRSEQYLGRLPESLRSRIWFTGPTDIVELNKNRKKALVTVVASRFETFSYAAAEAMALGCPLVCADVGGMAELIEDGRTGLLFAAGDAGALARQLAVALGDPARMARMGAAGRARAAEMLDPARIAARTVDFYRTVIADTAR